MYITGSMQNCSSHDHLKRLADGTGQFGKPSTMYASVVPERCRIGRISA